MTTSKTHTKKRLETLLALDQSLGPLVVGELTVSRIDLAAMGAQVAGKPVKTHRLAVREADQTLLDSIGSRRPDCSVIFVGVVLSATAAPLCYLSSRRCALHKLRLYWWSSRETKIPVQWASSIGCYVQCRKPISTKRRSWRECLVGSSRRKAEAWR